MRLGLALTLVALTLGLCSCAAAKLSSDKALTLKMNPPELKAGQMIEVSATPAHGVQMAWVSGTVKVFGAPVMPFKQGAGGAWTFKTVIPAFASIEPGTYEAKAWGLSLEGERYAGSLFINVK